MAANSVGIPALGREEVVRLAEAGEPHRGGGAPGRGNAEDDGGGAVGHGGAVGAAQRIGHHRVLVRHGAAEVLAEVLAELGVGVVHAVAVVLRRDGAQDVAELSVAVPVALLVVLRDLGEESREPGGGGLAGHVVVCAEQGRAHDVGPGLRHLLGADHQDGLRGAGQQRFGALLERGRAGGAGVLNPGGRDVGQLLRDLQGQRRHILLCIVPPGTDDEVKGGVAVAVGGVALTDVRDGAPEGNDLLPAWRAHESLPTLEDASIIGSESSQSREAFQYDGGGPASSSLRRLQPAWRDTPSHRRLRGELGDLARRLGERGTRLEIRANERVPQPDGRWSERGLAGAWRRAARPPLKSNELRYRRSAFVARSAGSCRNRCGPRSMSNSIEPDTIHFTGWSRNSNSVTIPKLPPPPRTAQSSSGFSLSVVRPPRPRP